MKILSDYFVNPFYFVIATLITFIYFLIICIPFYSTIFSIISYFEIQNIMYTTTTHNIFYITLYFMFILTIIYLFLDVFFGFTIKSFIKDKIDISKSKEFEIHYSIFVWNFWKMPTFSRWNNISLFYIVKNISIAVSFKYSISKNAI